MPKLPLQQRENGSHGLCEVLVGHAPGLVFKQRKAERTRKVWTVFYARGPAVVQGDAARRRQKRPCRTRPHATVVGGAVIFSVL